MRLKERREKKGKNKPRRKCTALRAWRVHEDEVTWPFCIQIQRYPTHALSAYGITQCTTHLNEFDVVPQFFHLHTKTHQLPRRTKERRHAHFDSPDPSTTNNFISDEVHTIHLVRMSRKVGLNLIRLQIPYPPIHHQKTSVDSVHKINVSTFFEKGFEHKKILV